MARKRKTVRRRRTSSGRGKVKFQQNVVLDTTYAGLATRVLPLVVNKFFPLSPTIYTVVGVGGAWLLGSMLKKPLLSNIAIGQGITELVAPMVEDLVGGITGTAPMLPTGSPVVKANQLNPAVYGKVTKEVTNVADYLHLNDYVSDPSIRQDKNIYSSSY